MNAPPEFLTGRFSVQPDANGPDAMADRGGFHLIDGAIFRADAFRLPTRAWIQLTDHTQVLPPARRSSA